MARLKKGLLRITYAVGGKNINYLPEYLHFKKINVYKFSPKSENFCFVTIDASDKHKFFAICKNMCYNKKIKGFKGILSPLAITFSNLGLVLGVILFTAFAFILNGTVLKIEVEGSAKRFERETLNIVENLGVKKYSRFSDIDFSQIENEVLSKNSRVSFVTAYKRGNVLVINAELASSQNDMLSKNEGDVVSNVNGVVEEISVLRGTALVKEGDIVKAGDLLVGAYVLGKEEGEIYKTFAVARVKVLEEVTFKYCGLAPSDRAVELAYALSEFELKSGEIKDKSHEIIGDKIVVTLTVRHVLYGGNS